MYRGGLSLRRLSVLVRNLPAEAATARQVSKSAPGWDTVAYLMADVYHALTGQPHPSRPQPEEGKKSTRYAKLRKALEAQRARTAPTDDKEAPSV